MWSLLCLPIALTMPHSPAFAAAAASPVSKPTPKAAAPTPQRRAAKSPARAPMRAPEDEGDQVGGAQKNRAKYQLDRLQESHDALKQRCDVLLLGLLVLTLLVVWSNYCTQTFFTNEYGRDAFCIFMALCFILSSENKESITALSKPKRYFLIFFGFMLLSMTKGPPWPYHSLLPRPPGVRGFGSGLRYALQGSASTAPTSVAPYGAAVSLCHRVAHLTAFMTTQALLRALPAGVPGLGLCAAADGLLCHLCVGVSLLS